jgi:myb proto-oncogene protein
LNCEDPLINHDDDWTREEDDSLLIIVQKKGIRNWFDISVSLATNRLPFQCLARFQRSLNSSMINSEWTEEEDAQLCSAVAYFGESDWQSVATVLERRTGTQCSNRLVHYVLILYYIYVWIFLHFCSNPISEIRTIFDGSLST